MVVKVIRGGGGDDGGCVPNRYSYVSVWLGLICVSVFIESYIDTVFVWSQCVVTLHRRSH